MAQDTPKAVEFSNYSANRAITTLWTSLLLSTWRTKTGTPPPKLADQTHVCISGDFDAIFLVAG
jgi:hypothetical protein